MQLLSMPTMQSEGQICQDANKGFANNAKTAGMSSKGGDSAGCLAFNCLLANDAYASHIYDR
jgi:hypothetical protein